MTMGAKADHRIAPLLISTRVLQYKEGIVKDVAAFSKAMPCFCRFCAALSSSHRKVVPGERTGGLSRSLTYVIYNVNTETAS